MVQYIASNTAMLSGSVNEWQGDVQPVLLLKCSVFSYLVHLLMHKVMNES